MGATNCGEAGARGTGTKDTGVAANDKGVGKNFDKAAYKIANDPCAAVAGCVRETSSSRACRTETEERASAKVGATKCAEIAAKGTGASDNGVGANI